MYIMITKKRIAVYQQLALSMFHSCYQTSQTCHSQDTYNRDNSSRVVPLSQYLSTRTGTNNDQPVVKAKKKKNNYIINYVTHKNSQ